MEDILRMNTEGGLLLSGMVQSAMGAIIGTGIQANILNLLVKKSKWCLWRWPVKSSVIFLFFNLFVLLLSTALRFVLDNQLLRIVKLHTNMKWLALR